MDRSVVWAEIDSILAAMDPSRASWVALLDSAGDDSLQSGEPISSVVLDFLVSLEDWAAVHQLEEVIPAMLMHGFDCASFINDVIGEADLQEMGLRCPAVRRRFLSAAADLPRGIETVAASLTPAATVETFLQRLCLQQHLATDFAQLRFCLIDCLAGVTDSELMEKFRIRKLGHRRRVLRCLGRLPPPLLMQPQPQPQHQQPPQTSEPAACAGNGSCNASSSSSSGHFSGRSSATAERIAAAQPASTCLRGSRCRSVESVGTVSDDQQPGRLTGFQPDVRPGWPHDPQVLLGGSVDYSVSYLGFRPLDNHTDRTEVSQVMQTFRCKSVDILKLPQICLSLCYLGVKFVNPDNEMVITEHRITDIYFACQDNTRRANFAYVTRAESASGTHYCHCFASHSQDETILIINTLSEACSLANQLIEFNQQLQALNSSNAVKRRRKHRALRRRTAGGGEAKADGSSDRF